MLGKLLDINLSCTYLEYQDFQVFHLLKPRVGKHHQDHQTGALLICLSFECPTQRLAVARDISSISGPSILHP